MSRSEKKQPNKWTQNPSLIGHNQPTLTLEKIPKYKTVIYLVLEVQGLSVLKILILGLINRILG